MISNHKSDEELKREVAELRRLVATLEKQEAKGAAAQALRQLAEHKPSAVKELLEELLAFNPAVLYRCKAGGDFGTTFISPNVTRQLGYDPIDFTHNSGFWTDHIHPDDRARVFAGLKDLFVEWSHRHEYRFRLPDGGYRWMLDELTLVRDERGEPKEIIGCWTDITDRKRVEEEIEHDREHLEQLVEERSAEVKLQEERFRAFFDSSPVGMAVLDRELRYIRVNQELARINGLHASEFVGKTVREVIPWNADKVEPILRRVIETGETVKGNELPASRAEAPGLAKHATLFPLLGLDGRPVGVGVIVVDITEQKNIEDRLRSYQEKLDLLTQSASMRTPNSLGTG